MGQKKKPHFDSAYEIYQSGLSLQAVANLLGVTRQCVYKAFRLRGYKLREKTFRPSKLYDGKTFTLRNNGYYSLTTNDRCLMHRYVYEKEKHKIPQGFDIHHINGDKTDNRIENLECLLKSEHTRKYSPHNNQFTRGRKYAAN